MTLSPMAAQIFIHLARKRQVFNKFVVDSAAVDSDAPEGVMMDSRVREILAKNGVDSGSHSSVQLDHSKLEKFDWIICMDARSRRMCFDRLHSNAVYVTPKDVVRVFRTDPSSPMSLNGMLKPRVCCLLDFTPAPRDIINPAPSGDYRYAFNEIASGCRTIVSLVSL
ncbi:hypothetical protein TRSA_15170 [Treponema saccharophilum]|uniref:protein-tyrosine-phosphatase n=1 Tax=Treponema saccharophilum DSM 2985 TaxID=907348 RepID=H7EGX9_9SPIR|nr:Protein-tyrosine phosphatase, low molecular weight [Treponema saccharophilum DSM 2985]BDC96418.1 hypothetical protein TRSA_15170 [Treponema saccharophilum]